MREIEFRGKRKSGMPELDGEWVYGSLYHAKFWQTGNVLCKIIPYEDDGERYHIHPDTVGQYTGLKDRNGVKIFEGDVVRYVPHDDNPPDLTGLGAVEWQNERNRFDLHKHDFVGSALACLDDDELEVIGNIYDNPELLKESNGNN